ncbi:hypothetical protein [Shinella sumterensis]|uniref:Uncharacterized protein n=2 Tax=Shinella TaxID=323620 RepID=A0AA50H6N9_9HYPH|nr:hypothetical protein [Shinella sumterensis]WLR96211.1 hypothetical protein Q9313_10780 [Shinella sumterensis]
MQALSSEEIECIAAVRSFKTDFDTTFVPTHPLMEGYALAVFADCVKVVPVTQVLRGGPNFARIFLDPGYSSLIVSRAIDLGGEGDLVTIMRMIHRTNDQTQPSKKDVKRAVKASVAFIQRVAALQTDWLFHGLSSTHH